MDTKKNTIQRKLILEAVKELGCHATAEQVYKIVIQKYPSISKATVYRNLSKMANAGELFKIAGIDSSWHYDHNLHAHYHFICEKCMKIFDIEDYHYDMFEKVKNINGFEIKNHSITFSGLCLECKEKPVISS